jgi:hypothetical protein
LVAFANLLHFTAFWTKSCSDLTAAAGIPLGLADDITFFEKTTPDATERACELGLARGAAQESRFAVHHRHALLFQSERRRLAEALKLRLLSYPGPDELLFIDEFHYRAESQRRIAEGFAERMDG